jgi:ribonuclease P protein component
VLPHQARLRRRDEFSTTVRSGTRAGTPALVVHLRSGDCGDASESGGPTRAGFVVSRAVGTAVDRNRVRRRLRHLVRDRLDRLPAGSRLVVRALPSSAVASSATLAAQLDRAIERLTSPPAAAR